MANSQRDGGDDPYSRTACAQSLLLDIARCPNVAECFDHSGEDNPCRSIVGGQGAVSLPEFQVPEPWTGHIETAPILFLSSNPAIDKQEYYPLWGWDDEMIVDFFSNRFELYIQDGVRHWLLSETYSHRATKYWAGVRRRAEELLGPHVRPGIDYALAEVVHCKSRAQEFVGQVNHVCVERYVSRLLEVSGAKVIVCMGDFAKAAVRAVLVRELAEIPDRRTPYVAGPMAVAGRERVLVFMRHTNFRGQRRFANCLSTELPMLRRFLGVPVAPTAEEQ